MTGLFAIIAQIVEQERKKRGRPSRPVVLVRDLNADRWAKTGAEEIFALMENAGFANAMALLPVKAHGTVNTKRYANSALDYVFSRGLKPSEPPRIIPNEGLSDHLAVFTIMRR